MNLKYEPAVHGRFKYPSMQQEISGTAVRWSLICSDCSAALLATVALTSASLSTPGIPAASTNHRGGMRRAGQAAWSEP